MTTKIVLAGLITYIPGFIKEPTEAFKTLWDDLEWERRDTTPRYEYYANKVDVPYTYGRGRGVRTYQPKPFHPVIESILKAVEDETKAKYEVCFLNGYEDKKHSLSWHADDSPEMDDDRPICIVSLGAAREIWFQDREGKQEVMKLMLDSGSLCIMGPGMQDTHVHRIPKASFECGSRISLTFRGYVDAESE